LSYLDKKLQAGETLYISIGRSRSWYSILAAVLVNLLALILVILISSALNGALQNPGSPAGNSGLFLLRLLVSLSPFIVLAFLVRDLVRRYRTEVALTDQRILGRKPGTYFVQPFEIPLEEVEQVQKLAGSLFIKPKNRPPLTLMGLEDTGSFVEAWEGLRKKTQ
jgi:hypothetical protein